MKKIYTTCGYCTIFNDSIIFPLLYTLLQVRHIAPFVFSIGRNSVGNVFHTCLKTGIVLYLVVLAQYWLDNDWPIRTAKVPPCQVSENQH